MDTNASSAMLGTVPVREMGTGLASQFRTWSKDPFNKNMDVVGWFLFIGLLAVATLAWQNILKKITS